MSASRTRIPFDNERYAPYAMAAAPAAIGCALGVLVAGKLREEQRPTAAIAFLSIGLAAAAPLAVDYLRKRFSGPASARGSERRLRSIRDSAIPVEEDIYSPISGDEATTTS